jgi:hypothetical protein
MKCYNWDYRVAIGFFLLNDNSEELGISDIETHEKENTFGISMTDESVFEIQCRRILEREDK